jgi:hypothetical protein
MNPETSNRYTVDADYIALKDGSRIPLDDGLCHTILIDCNGIELVQSILDAVTTAAGSVAGPVNIIIRRVGTFGGVPRLIADRGEIYDALVTLLAERNTK